MSTVESSYISHALESRSAPGGKAGFFSVSFTWLLLISYLSGSCFLPAEIISVSMLPLVVLLLADPFSTQRRLLFPGALFFIIILLTGMLRITGKVPYDIVKDLWYVGYPALTLLFGYVLAKRMDNVRSFLRAYIVAAVIVSVVHIFQFVLNPSYLSESLITIREQVSSGYLIVALGFGIIVGQLCFGLDLLPGKLVSWLGMVLCLLSITLSFSRTLWLCTITLVIVALILSNPRTALRLALATTVFIIVGLASTGTYKTATETNPDLTLTEKVMYSLKELQFSDYENMSDINRNWRGFESFRALQTYTSGSTVDYLFGKGFGTNVDLGFIMTLMDEEFEQIPVLHNGYMYLLVKTGAIGLSAYLLYLLLTLRTGTAFLYRPDPELRMSGFLLIALTIIMLETTVVIAGMFNKSWVFPSILLMGVLMGYAELNLGEKGASRIASQDPLQPVPREVL